MPRFVCWSSWWLAAVCLLACPAALLGQPPTERPAPGGKPKAEPAGKPEPGGKAELDGKAEPAGKANGKPAAAGPEKPRDGRLDVYYLKDKDGNLVQVPDFTYEDFRRLYDLDRNLTAAANSPPAYSLQSIAMTGTASEGQARLAVACKLLVKRDGWVRAPLRFPNAILREAPKWDGAGLQFTDYDRDGDGFVCWIQGRDEKPHSLKFDMVVPLRRLGDETRLAWTAPRATSSELLLTVPGQPGPPRLNDTASLVETKSVSPQSTQWKILGIGGDFQLAWTDAAVAKAPRSTAALEARGTILVRVEGRRRVTAEARLKVGSFGGPLESFRVRLPPHMDLQRLNEPGYSVSAPVETKDDDGATVREVVVTLDNKTTAPVEVRLRAVTSSQQEVAPLMQTAGFEVVGAVSQFGVLDLAVDGDWNVSWFEGPAVHRLEEIPEPQRQQKVVARFEYDRQPCSLKIQIQPRKTHLAVEPRHVVFAEAKRLDLETTLKCRVRGASAESIEIDLQGWEIDRILPDKLVQYELLNLDKKTPLTIPLTPSAALTNEFEIKLRAFREVGADESSVSFTLPRARASSQSPATLAIVPSDNVELTPRVAEIKGLIVESEPPAMALPPRQQPTLFYRDRVSPTPAEFVADRQVHSRTLSAVVFHDLQVNRDQIAVEQRFQLRAAYEPLKSVLFDVPESLAETEGTQFYWEISPQQLAPLEVEVERPAATAAGEAAADSPQPRKLLRAYLGEDRIGGVNLVVRFMLPVGEMAPEEEIETRVPLVRLAAEEKATLKIENLRWVAAAGLEARVANTEWQRGFASATADDKPLFTTTARPLEIPLAIKATRPLNRLGTVVHQAWVQTWLAGRQRHDRAVFHLSATESVLEFGLPEGARTDELIAAINGRATSFVVNEEGVVRIQIPEHLPADDLVVELAYALDQSRTSWKRFSLDLPRVNAAAATAFFRWRLQLPRGEHLTGTPRNVTPELAWRWRGVLWDRQATLSQRELELWSQATKQAGLDDDAVNAYLFSSFGSVESVEIRVTDRSSLVLLVSGALLAIGMLVLYFPTMRNPLFLVAAACVAAAGAFVAPEATLLGGQAGLLGVALIFLAARIQAVVLRQGQEKTVVRAAPLSGVESKASQQRAALREGSSYGTTATAQVAPISAPEPKP